MAVSSTQPHQQRPYPFQLQISTKNAPLTQFTVWPYLPGIEWIRPYPSKSSFPLRAYDGRCAQYKSIPGPLLLNNTRQTTRLCSANYMAGHVSGAARTPPTAEGKTSPQQGYLPPRRPVPSRLQRRGRLPAEGGNTPFTYSPQENAQASLRMINTTFCKSGDIPIPIKLTFKYAATIASVRPWPSTPHKLGICLMISMGIL